MPLPQRLGRFNRRVTNPLLWPIVSRLPGLRFGRIVHVGRRSGLVFRTPMLAFAHEDRLVFALTYGPHAQWVQNVLARGECDFETRRATHHLVDPRRFQDRERRSMPPLARSALGLMGTSDFLEMTVCGAPGVGEGRGRGATGSA